MSLNTGEWFNTDLADIKCGVEIELLLLDSKTKALLANEDKLLSVLGRIKSIKGAENIFKDFYTYQLEIRTKPHDTPQDVVSEIKKLYAVAYKEFIKERIYIIPAPSIAREGVPAYCGLHAHISYPKEKSKETYFKKAMGMLPFIYSLADHCKNFEISPLHTSDRISKSHHIGLPELDMIRWLTGDYQNPKYRDIIFSPPITTDDNPSRMKKPATIEIRILDTPSLFHYFEFMVYFIMNLAGKIKTNNPMITLLKDERDETNNRLNMTRHLLINQRYGVNKIFRMLSSDVCEQASREFNIKFPRETQFEFREKKGYSGDINGFLSMAVEGDWI